MASDITQLLRILDVHPNVAAANKLLKEIKTLSVKGLHGSSRALFSATLFDKNPRTTLFILNDLETAGYFYHDVSQILGSANVLFFPSAYKRAAKYGQIDAANEILRTEVLSRLQSNNSSLFIISYPDALAEKTVSQATLQENTLKLSVGEQVDSGFVSEVLDSYGFTYVDYVYEPGQYATRGSILDVFSFSNELPYRIDFFGDEVETIRNFEVESQLSKEKFSEIRIVPEFGKNKHKNASLFDSLPSETIIGIEDIRWIESRVESINNDDLSIDLSNEELVKAELLSKKEFLQSIKPFTHLRFDTKLLDTPDAVLQFQITSQPLFQKNFDLITDSLTHFLQNGYTLYILSDSEKQHQRLRTIFDDRGDNILFTPINKTLHEGFSDESLKICCFTDHQIFNRFHKYNLKSDKARSGKIALTLKEINQLQQGDFVVHMDHGIGKFAGLVRLRIGETVQEVIKLTYLNNDAVFVSIHSLHKISKYKGKEGESPQLNKLVRAHGNEPKRKPRRK